MIQAFFVYNVLLISLFGIWRACAPANLTKINSGRLENHVAISALSVLIYALVLGLRYKVGRDYEVYVDYFEDHDSVISSGDVILEIGFQGIVNLLNYFSLPPSALFVSMCALQMIFMTIWLRRHSQIAPWFFYFYFTSLLVFESMNIIRQVTALLVLLYGVQKLLDRKLLRYFFFVALACSLHKSAALFFPLYFFAHKEIPLSRGWQIIIFIIVYVFSSSLSVQLFDLLPILSAVIGYEDYGNIQEDLFFGTDISGFSPGLAFAFFTDLTIIYLSPWLKERYKLFGVGVYYNIYLIGAFLTPVVFFANYIPFSRLVLYFTGFKFVLLGFLISGIFSARSNIPFWVKWIAAIFVVAYYAWFVLAISQKAAECAPFQFVFD